jgi:hypothetical protein
MSEASSPPRFFVCFCLGVVEQFCRSESLYLLVCNLLLSLEWWAMSVHHLYNGSRTIYAGTYERSSSVSLYFSGVSPSRDTVFLTRKTCLWVGEVLAVEVGLEAAVEPPAAPVGRGARTTLRGLVVVPAEAKSLVPDWGDKVDSGIGLPAHGTCVEVDIR